MPCSHKQTRTHPVFWTEPCSPPLSTFWLQGRYSCFILRGCFWERKAENKRSARTSSFLFKKKREREAKNKLFYAIWSYWNYKHLLKVPFHFLFCSTPLRASCSDCISWSHCLCRSCSSSCLLISQIFATPCQCSNCARHSSSWNCIFISSSANAEDEMKTRKRQGYRPTHALHTPMLFKRVEHMGLNTV